MRTTSVALGPYFEDFIKGRFRRAIQQRQRGYTGRSASA